ncbi:uncharacterized protein [Miscanthus floridulus]|uniref:uncharacterized protein n=1 Tax=Miscanthus floridulus TaxID=154761 RepID=UPI0034585C4E
MERGGEDGSGGRRRAGGRGGRGAEADKGAGCRQEAVGDSDHLRPVNSCTMLVLKICSGYKEASKLPKRRILRGKVPSLSSLPLVVGFLNSLGGRTSNAGRPQRKDWDTGLCSLVAW